MKCVGIHKDFVMNMPLQVLKGLAADFDGDTLNIMYLINKDFAEAASRIFDPRNAMFISKNDGMFNSNMNQCRDTLINANTLMYLSRDKYNKKQLEAIKACKAMV